MTLTAQQAVQQVESNTPEVKGGQKWIRAEGVDHDMPREIRIVCRYPFSVSGEGRLWIFEAAYSFERLERVPELTLRQLYRLSEDVK